MTLAFIIVPPNTPRGFEEWTFHHAQHHLSAILAANKKFTKNLTVRELDPVIVPAFQDFLLRHQQSHDEMNNLLGTTGTDLESVDPTNERQMRAWFYLNFQEHVNWSLSLGL